VVKVRSAARELRGERQVLALSRSASDASR